jgi:hypothetical protein
MVDDPTYRRPYILPAHSFPVERIIEALDMALEGETEPLDQALLQWILSLGENNDTTNQRPAAHQSA